MVYARLSTPPGRRFTGIDARGFDSGLGIELPPEILHTLRFSLRLSQELIPVIRWMAAFQYLAEHPVSVIAALVGAFRIPINSTTPDQLAESIGVVYNMFQPILSIVSCTCALAIR